MAVEEGLLALASVAGQTVVTAAATDAWATAKRGFARLFGRGGQDRAGLAERRLEQTREELNAVPAAELEAVQAQLVAAWHAAARPAGRAPRHRR